MKKSLRRSDHPQTINKRWKSWIVKNQFQLTIFNVFLILLVLLRSAGYFQPFIELTINIIFLSALIVSTFLLDAKSRAFFAIAVIFWIIAAVLKIINIQVWAERAALYSFESLTLGILLSIFERLAYQTKDYRMSKPEYKNRR